MGQWTLPGPDRLTLTKPEVAAILGISTGTLDRMVRGGRFPRGHKTTPQAKPFWTGADVAAWLLISPRMLSEEEISAEK
jgi:predicted DNA-binding transcriptional regulator AlpA